MPVTSFALLVLTAIASVVLTVWAAAVWGVGTIVPLVLLALALARWAMTPVAFDDSSHP